MMKTIVVVVLSVRFLLFRWFQTLLDSSITFSAVSDTNTVGNKYYVKPYSETSTSLTGGWWWVDEGGRGGGRGRACGGSCSTINVFTVELIIKNVGNILNFTTVSLFSQVTPEKARYK